METNFKVGDTVKCIGCEYTKRLNNRYFKVLQIIKDKKAPILDVISIDKRLPDYQNAQLFNYKFEKAGQEYIILKLKGIVE